MLLNLYLRAAFMKLMLSSFTKTINDFFLLSYEGFGQTLVIVASLSSGFSCPFLNIIIHPPIYIDTLAPICLGIIKTYHPTYC